MNNLSFVWLAEQIVQENSDAIMFADYEGNIGSGTRALK